MGVSWHKGKGKFVAFAPLFGFQFHLGYFVNRQDAVNAERDFYAQEAAAKNRLLWILEKRYKVDEDAILGYAIEALAEFGRDGGGQTPIGFIVRRVGEMRAAGEYARDIKDARACMRACEECAWVYAYVCAGEAWDSVRGWARVQYGDFREAVREICG